MKQGTKKPQNLHYSVEINKQKRRSYTFKNFLFLIHRLRVLEHMIVEISLLTNDDINIYKRKSQPMIHTPTKSKWIQRKIFQKITIFHTNLWSKGMLKRSKRDAKREQKGCYLPDNLGSKTTSMMLLYVQYSYIHHSICVIEVEYWMI